MRPTLSEMSTTTELTGKALTTRWRILAAALTLFQQKGFDQTTMRDIATAAGLAVGATYYYFKTKDELVLAFYLATQQESKAECERICAGTLAFEGRVLAIIAGKFRQFQPYQRFFGILFRNAADPHSAISPFSRETRAIREQAIDLFRVALQGVSVKIAADLRPHLPRLLWLYQMGLILYWIHDRSPHQQRTQKLTENSFRLLLQTMRLSRLPFIGRLRQAVITMLKEAGVDENDLQTMPVETGDCQG